MPHDARDQFLAAEALIPINDLLEEHGKNILSLYGDYINRMYKPEYGGNIYSWTGFGMSRDLETPGSGFYICADALEANGWPVITDVDTYFDMIIDFAEKNPTMNGNKTIAFSGPAEGWRFAFFMLGADKLMGMHKQAVCTMTRIITGNPPRVISCRIVKII
jgi:putative aldouronate transport system substrate-binding protein